VRPRRGTLAPSGSLADLRGSRIAKASRPANRVRSHCSRIAVRSSALRGDQIALRRGLPRLDRRRVRKHADALLGSGDGVRRLFQSRARAALAQARPATVFWRLKNTRQVPAPRAFVSDQTGLVEERRDGRDLSHLCCFASRTQQGSSGALTRHRLLHGGAPLRFVCTPLTFQRSYSAVGCERLCEWSRSRRARETRPLDHRREHVGYRHRLRAVLDLAREWALQRRATPPATQIPPRRLSPHWSSGDH
jgi:hypothetical protein